MKKSISIILTAILLLTIIMPVSAFAGNGPYQNKGENDSDMAIISFVDVYGGISYIYPLVSDKYKSSKNISYDVKTNTLTLNGFKTDDIMVITAMGDDFKIKLSGYNELGCIISSDLSWGSSVTVTGKGVLYVNEKKQYADAIYMNGSGTGKVFFKVEKNVGVKLYKGEDNAIGIYGVAEADTSKTIILEGTVNAGQAASYKYVRNIYEQEKLRLAEHYEGTGVFCGKTGAGNENKIFIAEAVDQSKNTYNVAEVVYDSEFKKYTVLPVTDSNKNIVLEANGYTALAEDKYPEDVIAVDDYAVDMDVCIDENGKRCVFVDYSDLEKPESDIEVYEILEHTKYGKTALLYNPKNTYKELKKLKSITEYNHIITSDSVTVNNASKTVPSKVKLKSAVNSQGCVTVSWDKASGATSYRVYRSYLEKGKWSKWSQIGKTAKTSYNDNKATSGVTYKYTVRAENLLGLGAYDANGVSVTYLSVPKVTNSNASNGIKTSWQKVSGATGYIVYRSQYSGGKWSGWKSVATLKADKTYYGDTGVSAGETYRYTVRALCNKTKSSFKASDGIMYLSVPTVKIANAKNGVSVSWNKIKGALNYTVYRAELVNGKWSSWKVLDKACNNIKYVDTTAVSGVTYKYTVRAVNNQYRSSYKNSSQLLYLLMPTVKIQNASNGIKVSWSKANGATGYIVYRSQYSGGKWSGWKSIGTTKAAKLSFVDKGTKAGVQYRYTVRAINGNVKSTFAATNGLVRLLTPTVKAATANAGIKVTWSKASGATGYIVYRAEYVNGKWSSWKNIGKLGNVSSYTDTAVTSGVAYRYTVRAYNGTSYSGYTAGSAIKK